MKYKLTLGQMLKIKPKHVESIAAKVYDAVKELSEAVGADPEDAPVKRITRTVSLEEMSVKARKFPGEPALKNDRTFAIIATTPHMDRDREVVLSKGIDLAEWLPTGAILESHDYGQLPIGKAVWTGQLDRGVKMHIEAADTARGNEMLALSKFMPLTASIGFIPTEIIDKNHANFPREMARLSQKFDFIAEKRDSIMRIITKSIMLETSIVSVPSNPNAIQDVLAKAKEAYGDDVIDESCYALVTKSFNGDRGEDPDDDGDPAKSATVSAEWLKEHGFVLKDGVPVKKTDGEDPSPKKKKRTIQVVKRPRKIEVISTPEEQSKAFADDVRGEVELLKGGV